MSASQYYHSVLDFAGRHLLSCPSQVYLGIGCPGCGLQRSVLLLLRGHVAESIALYPAALPMILMFIILLLHVRFKFSRGAMVLQYLFIFNIVLIFISYITRYI